MTEKHYFEAHLEETHVLRKVDDAISVDGDVDYVTPVSCEFASKDKEEVKVIYHSWLDNKTGIWHFEYPEEMKRQRLLVVLK